MIFNIIEILRHKLVHSDERAWKCDWPNCGQSFKLKLTLQVHYLKHTGEKPVSCDVQDCDRRFQTRQAMRFHLERHHHIQAFFNKKN